MNAPSKSTALANPFEAWFLPIPALNGLSMIDHLYNRLDGAYPHKWRSNFPSPEAIDNWKISWAEAFEDERIDPIDIRDGLKACRAKHDWPPSCAEFIKACKPDASIDSMRAYYEALAGVQARAAGEVGKWSHPAVYWASVPLAYDLGTQTYSQIKGRWDQAFFEQMERGEWPNIPVPMVAIAAPGKGDLSRENAKKMIEELGASSVIAPKTDHRLWAKRIMDRIKRGDKTVTMIMRKFAQEAIEAPLH